MNDSKLLTKTYPYKLMMTPYEKLKSLLNAESYLKEGITFDSLDRQALMTSDLEAAKQLQAAKSKLFAKIVSKKQDIVKDSCLLMNLRCVLISAMNKT